MANRVANYQQSARLARGGSIVLMHLGGYNTYAALPEIMAGLRASGLLLVTLSTMLDY